MGKVIAYFVYYGPVVAVGMLLLIGLVYVIYVKIWGAIYDKRVDRCVKKCMPYYLKGDFQNEEFIKYYRKWQKLTWGLPIDFKLDIRREMNQHGEAELGKH